MAAITSAGTTWNTTGGNTTVTATPAINDLIIVIAASSGLAGGTTAVTDDNSSGTYTQVDVDRTGFSTTGVLTVWVRNSLITAASSTIFTAAQGSSSGGGLTVLRVSGMTRAGAVAIRGTGGESTGTSATTPAPVLASTPLPGNPVIAAVCCGTNSTTNFTPRTGYTEHNDSGYNTPATGLETMSRASGETSATITWGSTAPSTFASVAIELDTSGSTGKVYTNPQTQAPYAAAGGQAPFQQRQWQPPIPMRIWGTTSPAPPPTPGDLPLVPVVAHAVESIETRPYRFVETLLVDPAAAASSDTPQRPLVIQGPQPFLYLRQSPYAYIARQPGDNPVGLRVPRRRRGPGRGRILRRRLDTPAAGAGDRDRRPT